MSKIEKLNEIKQYLMKMSSKKTKLSVNDVVFEFSGELEVGTELNFLENGEDVSELTLEDGRTLTIEDNKVASLSALESEEDEDDDQQELDLEEDEESEDEESDDLEEDEESEEQEFDAEERINQLESTVDELNVRIASMEEMVEAMGSSNENQEELFSELITKVEELSKAPAVEGDKREISNNFNKTKNKSRASKVLGS